MLQAKHAQTTEPICNNLEIGVRDAGVKGSGNGLRQVQLNQPREPRSHLAKHERPRPDTQLLPLGALQMKPSLANQPDDLLFLVALQFRQNRPSLMQTPDASSILAIDDKEILDPNLREKRENKTLISKWWIMTNRNPNLPFDGRPKGR